MNHITGFFLVLILFSVVSIGGQAQSTDVSGASVAATIIEPGSMAKTINADFGNVAIVLSAFVKMAPVDKGNSGGIILPVSAGTFTAAIYDFTGTTGLTYTVSYPTNPIIIKTGSEDLQVASITSDPARNAGSDLIAGVFVSVSSSNVTVNYN